MAWALRMRVMATLLLALHGFVLAREAGPRAAAACACAHGAEQPCDCPAHASAAPAPADDDKLPPCHRKLRKARPAAPAAPADGPCLRAGCGLGSSELLLLSWVQLPAPAERPAEPFATPHPLAPGLTPEDAALEPPSPPPKVAI